MAFSRSLFRNIFAQLLRHPARKPPPPTAAQPLHRTATRHTFAVAPKPSAGHTNNAGTNWCLPLILPAGLFSFLSPRLSDAEAAEQTPEGKLIMTLKRSVLCIQREQYDKAEQMLHLALRMAQDLRHTAGITYCFDLMANLAMERGQYAKAQRLFVQVMQHLLQEGRPEDDLKMLHISAKVAQMEALQGHAERAETGFQWVLAKVQKRLADAQTSAEDRRDLRELGGLTKDCYAQLLLRRGGLAESRRLFAEALDTYVELHGREEAEVVALLNNLAVVCTSMDDLGAAERYIAEALELAAKHPDLYESGVYQANHGMLLMRQGLYEEAQRVCADAWRRAKRAKSDDGSEQAEHCLKELKKLRLG